MYNPTNTQSDRIAGAMFGVAVGDALGGPVEFMSAGEINAEYGHVSTMKGGGWLGLHPGEVTDDTQMTLCVAEGIVENPAAPIEAVGRRFIEWADSGPKDIGATCALSILRAKLAAGGNVPTAAMWAEAGKREGRPAEGNGALMRTVYPGLYYEDVNIATTRAKSIAMMTHNGPESADACVLYTAMINYLTDTARPEGITARQVLMAYTHGTPYQAAAEAVAVEPTMGGYVVDSMTVAIASLASTRSFRDAVEAAVNAGGDADTNAAITGGLAGAWYGFDAIPEEWVRALDVDVQEHIKRLVDAAAEAREEVEK